MPINPGFGITDINSFNSSTESIKRKVITQQTQRTFVENVEKAKEKSFFFLELRTPETSYYNASLGKNVVRKTTGTTNFS